MITNFGGKFRQNDDVIHGTLKANDEIANIYLRIKIQRPITKTIPKSTPVHYYYNYNIKNVKILNKDSLYLHRDELLNPKVIFEDYMN
jgi:hypothetical protein